MREIKFRAIKDQMSFEFAYGDGICYSPSDMPRIPDKNGMLYTCLKGTEGQYTGLKDKNGVEIYDGDIVSCYDSAALDPLWGLDKIHTGVIIFLYGAFVLKCHNGTKKVQGNTDKTYEDYVYLEKWLNAENTEIIGNIHQNPDLLQ